MLLIGVMTESEIRKTTGGSTEWLDPSKWKACGRRPKPFLCRRREARHASRDLRRTRAASASRRPQRAPNRGSAKMRSENSSAAGWKLRASRTVALAQILELTPSEVDSALLALEAEGFVLRGKFSPDASETEWCDRRLLARIHRLTIHRLRAGNRSGVAGGFSRFLLAWQRASPATALKVPRASRPCSSCSTDMKCPRPPGNRKSRPYENNYTPAWLDQLCFTAASVGAG